ncbi:xylose isomerase [Bradyrhizobium sp. LM6.10]
MNASVKFFDASAPVAFAGKDAGNTSAFRWYDKDRLVHGRRME